MRHEDVWGNEGVGPLILNLGNGCRSMASLTSRPLYPRHNTPSILRTGGWVGLGVGLDSGDEKYLVPVPGIEAVPLGCPACSPYAVPTTQTWPIFLSLNIPPPPSPLPKRYEQLLTVMLMLVTLTEGHAVQVMHVVMNLRFLLNAANIWTGRATGSFFLRLSCILDIQFVTSFDDRVCSECRI
jgi:hypothetical protein